MRSTLCDQEMIRTIPMKAQYSNLSILQGISPEDQELLLSMAQEVRFQAGDLILRDSEVASDFYVLVQGVPEPSAASLIIFSAGALLALRRRRGAV